VIFFEGIVGGWRGSSKIAEIRVVAVVNTDGN
jgi:hypothetical protein